jgi:fatty acid synthase
MQEEQKRVTISDAKETTDSSKPDSESNTDETDMAKTLVRLNKVESDRILFLLHGAGGGVQVMAKLAQRMKYTVYGIQDTPEAPLTGTLERLARFYLEKIKEKQTEGPYLLGGFSFGNAYPLFYTRR